MTKQLYRSQTNRIIAGVAGGLGEYFAIDPIIFRLLFLVLTFGGGAGVLLYLIAWIIIPEDTTAAKDETKHTRDVKKEVEDKVETIARDVTEAGKRISQGSQEHNTIGGLVLLALGVLFLVQNLTEFDVWGNFWPILLIALGLGIIIRRNKRSS